MLRATNIHITKELLAATAYQYGGFADESCNTEWALMNRLIAARTELAAAIAAINAKSGLVSVDADTISAVLSDELPSVECWEEKISSARRGWED